MTDLATSSRSRDGAAGLDPVVAMAYAAADTAAAASGVVVLEVRDLAGIAAVSQLFTEIWGREQGPPITPELLRAMSKAGCYVAGAFHAGALVGAAVGFHEAPAERTLHSHITGVAAGPWRRVGYALKLHQRAWALDRGIDTIAWTFDPLVARNAYFNIAKLRSHPVEYLPDFYGTMADAINGHDETDRLLTRWSLRDADVVAACSGIAAAGGVDVDSSDAIPALEVTPAGPVARAVDTSAGGLFLVPVPSDISALRTADMASARLWRRAVREALAPLLAAGGRVVGFDRDGAYLVQLPIAASSLPPHPRSDS